MKKNNTMELWHGTCVPQFEKIYPVSFCLGNMFEAPQTVAYYWRTWEESALWSVFKMLSYFEEYIEDPDADIWFFKAIGFKPIPDGFTAEDFIPRYSWDPVKGKMIIADDRDIDESNKTVISNLLLYLDKVQPTTFQYKVDADKKKIGRGQTSTINEYTLTESAQVTEKYQQTVDGDEFLACVEFVSPEYFENNVARRYAALFNRGLKSLLYTNELVYNVVTNQDKFVKMRHECVDKDEAFVKSYIKDNKCVEHLYPLKRIKLYMDAKRKLKAVQ